VSQLSAQLKLVNHPVRIRICQALHRAKLSTSQLHALLKDVPKPSLYRHLRLLLANGLIQVAETRLVNGIEEKIYTIDDDALHITQEDVQREVSAAQLAEFALIYSNAASSEFAEHLMRSAPPDLNQVLFHDYVFYATDEAFAELKRAIHRMFTALEAQPPEAGSTRRRLLILGHPSSAPEPDLATIESHESQEMNDENA
jgi:DNA-binding transcriptional ArsR family regulator